MGWCVVMVNKEERTRGHVYNFQKILAFIFNHRFTSQSEISSALEINKATVSKIYSELKQKQFVNEVGAGVSSPTGGRKPRLIEINKTFGYTLCVELTEHEIKGLACYLNGATIQFHQLQISRDSDLIVCLDKLIGMFENIQGTLNGLLGICFAIHGKVHNNQVLSSYLNLNKIDLVNHCKKYNVPVILENEANLSAIYSRDFIRGNREENAVTLSIHQGIYAGFILNNRLYRGSHGQVGDIGNNIIMSSFPISNGEKLLTYQDLYAQDTVVNSIGELVGQANLTLFDLSKLYEDHNDDVVAGLSQFANGISEILHNIAGTIAPDIFYINSPLIHQIPSILTQIKKYFERISGYSPLIQSIPNVPLATLLGGAALMTHYILELDDLKLNFWNYTEE